MTVSYVYDATAYYPASNYVGYLLYVYYISNIKPTFCVLTGRDHGNTSTSPVPW